MCQRMPLHPRLFLTNLVSKEKNMQNKEDFFSIFNPVSSKQWKQQIQYELKGADYNETLIWESPEGIKVKPFYHSDENIKANAVVSESTFKVLQKIFVHNEEAANKRTLDVLNRGAENIYFTIENENISIEKLVQGLPISNTIYTFYLPFLSIDFVKKTIAFLQQNNFQFKFLVDPIAKLASEGNWFSRQKSDFDTLQEINNSGVSFLNINTKIYQNAGANMVQQLAYSLAHLHEYLGSLNSIHSIITIEVSIGTNYFFEIAKLRALRILMASLLEEYDLSPKIHIIAQPTLRNKTLYDYNTNMLRTTTECMSAILGGADEVTNLPYDYIYHKENEFGDRIARNQLLILKNESYFDIVNNAAEGSYYIESITHQLAEKALELFKEIEKTDGFITHLIKGNIQKKIDESAQKEQEDFDTGKEILLGTNKYPNKNDLMKNDLELFPFVKQNPRKTLITPIISRRLAEKMEQERLENETI